MLTPPAAVYKGFHQILDEARLYDPRMPAGPTNYEGLLGLERAQQRRVEGGDDGQEARAQPYR